MGGEGAGRLGKGVLEVKVWVVELKDKPARMGLRPQGMDREVLSEEELWLRARRGVADGSGDSGGSMGIAIRMRRHRESVCGRLPGSVRLSWM